MFNSVSMTGSGLLTMGLGLLLHWLGVNVETSQIAGWVDSIINVVGLVMLIIGQLKRKDLTFGLFRKVPLN